MINLLQVFITFVGKNNIVGLTRHLWIFVLVAAFPIALISQGTWELVPIPTSKNLNSEYFIDSLTGWVVGDSGIILHTHDGGHNWEFQESNTNNDIIDVFFLNQDYGWATSHTFSSLPYGTLLLNTNNGGSNWDTISYPQENIFIQSIYYHDSLTGWMGGNPHALVSTTDGGITWHQADIDTSTLAFFPVLNIEFYDEQYGYASGGIFDIAGVIWRTSNGGQKWYAIEPDDAPADEVHGIYTFDSVNVIGSGGDPDFGFGVGFTKTENGGVSWLYDEIGVQGIAFDVDFVSSYEGWAPLGYENKFIYSIDTGDTWVDVPTPESTSIFDIMFTDSLHGFAVGSEGAFLRFIPKTPVAIVEIDASRKIKVDQNFPNPVIKSTTINVNYPNGIKSSLFYLSIYDMMGIEVARILPESKNDNNFEFIFKNENLSPGIYYYKVVADQEVSDVRTMILL